uniref:Fanconi anemia group m protein isoform x1 n=1 Tax=Triatoma infestans TaxID=30076 RepID=A0A161MJD0_TRIIF
MDDMDDSFINDESHYQAGNDTHIEYLRSIKSPKGGRGKFKIPMDKLCDNMDDIYSQQVEQDTEYVNELKGLQAKNKLE